MMEALKVMTYFNVSLSTHNWDRAFCWRAGLSALGQMHHGLQHGAAR